MCVDITCYDVVYRDYQNVCSGHGLCIGYNICECHPGYYGDNCDSLCESSEIC